MTTTKQNFTNYLTQAILLTLPCCLALEQLAVFCLPLGIVAIVYKAQAKTRLQLADYQGADKASKSAKKWFWFGFIPVAILLVLVRVLDYVQKSSLPS
ncbi:MAG: CD225/dispanin family protein [Okeania sp. SIO3B5]|uniref:CD225/dispanin family protein n=1 Tax=Okeania sp. SIO3B5 TaxID=2607811 RepID=UPI0013FE6F3F|nr:CD225/dispanin family protein [Okeania sp. SIO3B5]NEO51757.1 CD225/dispanin family protein [Okeania sp. SIO3B5]